MTRTEAILSQLAEEVMGWCLERTHKLCCDDFHQHQAPQCCCPDCWCHDHAGTPKYYIRESKCMVVPGDGARSYEWVPDRDPAQALELLEAWCDAGANRRYAHQRLAKDEHLVWLFGSGGEVLAVGVGKTFPEATYRAVCMAEGIEVDA